MTFHDHTLRRQEIETKIEELIELLDLIDGDENLETTTDEEFSLGWPEKGPQALQQSCTDDRERDDADYDDDREDEPWLGWPAVGIAALDPSFDHGLSLESELGGGVTATDAGRMYDLEEDCSDYELNGDELDSNFAEDDHSYCMTRDDHAGRLSREALHEARQIKARLGTRCAIRISCFY